MEGPPPHTRSLIREKKRNQRLVASIVERIHVHTTEGMIGIRAVTTCRYHRGIGPRFSTPPIHPFFVNPKTCARMYIKLKVLFHHHPISVMWTIPVHMNKATRNSFTTYQVLSVFRLRVVGGGAAAGTRKQWYEAELLMEGHGARILGASHRMNNITAARFDGFEEVFVKFDPESRPSMLRVYSDEVGVCLKDTTSSEVTTKKCLSSILTSGCCARYEK